MSVNSIFLLTCTAPPPVHEYPNDISGIQAFLTEYSAKLQQALCVIETTGGYEAPLLLTLCQQHIAVHRANTRHVKSFIRSYGHGVKTDALDAKALARYGYERHETLACYEPPNDTQSELYNLVSRQHDLKQMRTAEKNRLKAPNTSSLMQASCSRMIEMLTNEIEAFETRINALIADDELLTFKKTAIQTIPGIGKILSSELIVLLPELGQLSRREIASLVGVAPRANDSGRHQGYRSTGHGRPGIKPRLYMAAMAARNSNSSLKTFYNGLVERGKPKKVALTALMRKIIVIANARIKALNLSIQPT